MLLLVKWYDRKMVKLPRGSSCGRSHIQLTNKKIKSPENISFKRCLFCILTRERVLGTMFTGWNHIFKRFHILFHQLHYLRENKCFYYYYCDIKLTPSVTLFMNVPCCWWSAMTIKWLGKYFSSLIIYRQSLIFSPIT